MGNLLSVASCHFDNLDDKRPKISIKCLDCVFDRSLSRHMRVPLANFAYGSCVCARVGGSPPTPATEAFRPP